MSSGQDVVVDFARLRRQVYRAHSQTIAGTSVAHCPYCAQPVFLNSMWQLHEALVKRSAVPEAKQHLIFTVENCVPLHRDCHQQAGQTKEMRRRCLDALIRRIGAELVFDWYFKLWYVHGLSLPRGDIETDNTCEEYLEEIFG